jgi:hypothetical protein
MANIIIMFDVTISSHCYPYLLKANANNIHLHTLVALVEVLTLTPAQDLSLHG